MAPFLFLLAAEGFNMLWQEAVAKQVFEGVKIGNHNIMLSRLQFADDTIIFGKWSTRNLKATYTLLNCWRDASGLKVNWNKSCLLGFGVGVNRQSDMAKAIDCKFGLGSSTTWGHQSMST